MVDVTSNICDGLGLGCPTPVRITTGLDAQPPVDKVACGGDSSTRSLIVDRLCVYMFTLAASSSLAWPLARFSAQPDCKHSQTVCLCST